jgi:hypothetical protein
VEGTIDRVDLADSTALAFEGAAAEAGTVSYDGTGSAILFLDATGRLQRVPEGATSAEPVAESVSDYWPVPKSSKVLAISEGTLRLFAFGAP